MQAAAPHRGRRRSSSIGVLANARYACTPAVLCIPVLCIPGMHRTTGEFPHERLVSAARGAAASKCRQRGGCRCRGRQRPRPWSHGALLSVSPSSLLQWRGPGEEGAEPRGAWATGSMMHGGMRRTWRSCGDGVTIEPLACEHATFALPSADMAAAPGCPSARAPWPSSSSRPAPRILWRWSTNPPRQNF